MCVNNLFRFISWIKIPIMSISDENSKYCEVPCKTKTYVTSITCIKYRKMFGLTTRVIINCNSLL